MRWRRLGVGLGLLGLAAVATVIMVPSSKPTDFTPIPIHSTPDWPERALAKLNATAVKLSAVDRIELHAIDPADIYFESTRGLVGLGSLARLDLGAAHQDRLAKGRSYRAKSSQALFPTDPFICPEHAIIASRVLVGDQAQQLLQLWRSQMVDCDPEGFALCHAPHFALTLYAGQRRLLEVSICWWCQNMQLFAGEESVKCNFAVRSSASNRLKAVLKSYCPGVPTEEELEEALTRSGSARSRLTTEWLSSPTVCSTAR